MGRRRQPPGEGFFSCFFLFFAFAAATGVSGLSRNSNVLLFLLVCYFSLGFKSFFGIRSGGWAASNTDPLGLEAFHRRHW